MNQTNPKPVGRPLTQNSIRMSEAMFKARLLNNETLQSIADRYNKKFAKDGSGRNLSVQAVQGRIDRFKAKFPEKVAAILGSIPEPKETEATNEAELVTA